MLVSALFFATLATLATLLRAPAQDADHRSPGRGRLKREALLRTPNFLHPGRLAAQAAQVIQFRAPHPG